MAGSDEEGTSAPAEYDDDSRSHSSSSSRDAGSGGSDSDLSSLADLSDLEIDDHGERGDDDDGVGFRDFDSPSDRPASSSSSDINVDGHHHEHHHHHEAHEEEERPPNGDININNTTVGKHAMVDASLSAEHDRSSILNDTATSTSSASRTASSLSSSLASLASAEASSSLASSTATANVATASSGNSFESFSNLTHASPLHNGVHDGFAPFGRAAAFVDQEDEAFDDEDSIDTDTDIDTQRKATLSTTRHPHFHGEPSLVIASDSVPTLQQLPPTLEADAAMPAIDLPTPPLRQLSPAIDAELFPIIESEATPVIGADASEPIIEPAVPEPIIEPVVPEPEPIIEPVVPEPIIEPVVPEPEPITIPERTAFVHDSPSSFFVEIGTEQDDVSLLVGDLPPIDTELPPPPPPPVHDVDSAVVATTAVDGSSLVELPPFAILPEDLAEVALAASSYSPPSSPPPSPPESLPNLATGIDVSLADEPEVAELAEVERAEPSSSVSQYSESDGGYSTPSLVVHHAPPPPPPPPAFDKTLIDALVAAPRSSFTDAPSSPEGIRGVRRDAQSLAGLSQQLVPESELADCFLPYRLLFSTISELASSAEDLRHIDHLFLELRREQLAHVTDGLFTRVSQETFESACTGYRVLAQQLYDLAAHLQAMVIRTEFNPSTVPAFLLYRKFITTDTRALARYIHELVQTISDLITALTVHDEEQAAAAAAAEAATEHDHHEQAPTKPRIFDTTLYYRAIHYYLRNILRQGLAMQVRCHPSLRCSWLGQPPHAREWAW